MYIFILKSKRVSRWVDTHLLAIIQGQGSLGNFWDPTS